MDGTFTDWLPDSPTRSPAWRWAKARWLRATGRRARPRIDDAWVARARRFLAARDGRGPGPARSRVPRPDPAIRAACDLAHAEDPAARWKMEAYLLTPLPPEEVAARCAAPVAVVEAFHQLFFACRDRPEARDWLLIHAVGAGPWDGDGDPRPGGIWRYAAFAGGAPLLEVMIAVTTDRPMPDWVLASSRNRAYDEARLRLNCKLLIALMAARTDAEVAGLVAIRDEARRIHDPATGRRRGPQTVSDVVGRLPGDPARGRPARVERAALAEVRGRSRDRRAVPDRGRGPVATPQGREA